MTFKKYIFSLFFFLCVACTALLIPLHHSFAQSPDCTSMRLSHTSSITLKQTYDPFKNRSVNQSIFFDIIGKQGCSFTVGLSDAQKNGIRTLKGGSSAFEDLKVKMALKKNGNNPFQDFDNSSQSRHFISGSFERDNQRRQERYFIILPKKQTVTAGFYTKTLTLSLYTGGLSNPILVDQRSITYKVEVAPVIDVKIQTAGSRAKHLDNSKSSLNFGTLTTGKRKDFSLLIKGNTAYQITINSLNKGNMVHENTRQTIPYQLTFDGRSQDLNKPLIVNKQTNTSGRSFKTARTLKASVRIGSFERAVAGNYEDTLTISVQAW